MSEVDDHGIAPGDGVYLATLWEKGPGEAVVPAILYVRGVAEGETGGERFSLGRDLRRAPWGVFRLGGDGDPYLLWREGERIIDRHFFRVPAPCGPGRYRIEVTVDGVSFFPVRRLSGLERGAVRGGWTVVDTLEVTS